MEKPSVPEGRVAELADTLQSLQQNYKILEAENKELASMCQQKDMEIEQHGQENAAILEQLNGEKEKLLELQQELSVAQNDRIKLQEELAQNLLLLERKEGGGTEELRKKFDKKVNQLKEAREAFGILVTTLSNGRKRSTMSWRKLCAPCRKSTTS
eukprot:TRINITY_DN7148_c0_g1_i7.p1 TRINITY_DN7148_c0_g1~~TRINITY_DN7148_c0_g1_i7.p1  ORF type:complete len:156 (-),score=43.93 TRINITY_DN7148_c0_g1_i7:155-622(-)